MRAIQEIASVIASPLFGVHARDRTLPVTIQYTSSVIDWSRERHLEDPMMTQTLPSAQQRLFTSHNHHQ